MTSASCVCLATESLASIPAGCACIVLPRCAESDVAEVRTALVVQFGALRVHENPRLLRTIPSEDVIFVHGGRLDVARLERLAQARRRTGARIAIVILWSELSVLAQYFDSQTFETLPLELWGSGREISVDLEDSRDVAELRRQAYSALTVGDINVLQRIRDGVTIAGTSAQESVSWMRALWIITYSSVSQRWLVQRPLESSLSDGLMRLRSPWHTGLIIAASALAPGAVLFGGTVIVSGLLFFLRWSAIKWGPHLRLVGEKDKARSVLEVWLEADGATAALGFIFGAAILGAVLIVALSVWHQEDEFHVAVERFADDGWEGSKAFVQALVRQCTGAVRHFPTSTTVKIVASMLLAGATVYSGWYYFGIWNITIRRCIIDAIDVVDTCSESSNYPWIEFPRAIAANGVSSLAIRSPSKAQGRMSFRISSGKGVLPLVVDAVGSTDPSCREMSDAATLDPGQRCSYRLETEDQYTGKFPMDVPLSVDVNYTDFVGTDKVVAVDVVGVRAYSALPVSFISQSGFPPMVGVPFVEVWIFVISVLLGICVVLCVFIVSLQVEQRVRTMLFWAPYSGRGDAYGALTPVDWRGGVPMQSGLSPGWRIVRKAAKVPY